MLDQKLHMGALMNVFITLVLDPEVCDPEVQHMDATRQRTKIVAEATSCFETATVAARPSASAARVEIVLRVVVAGVIAASAPFLTNVEVYPDVWRLRLGLDSGTAEVSWTFETTTSTLC